MTPDVLIYKRKINAPIYSNIARIDADSTNNITLGDICSKPGPGRCRLIYWGRGDAGGFGGIGAKFAVAERESEPAPR